MGFFHGWAAPGIIQLIEPFEKDGTLVKRSRTEIERDIAISAVLALG